jgi:hypothetical protein
MQPEIFIADGSTIQIIKNNSGVAYAYCDTSRFILLPGKFYSEELKEQYFRFSHELNDDDILLESNSIGNDVVLFSLKKNFKEKLDNNYHPAGYYHYTALLAKYFSPFDSQQRSEIIINVQKEHFYMLIASKGRLLLANTYTYAHPTDICYYVLNGVQHAGIDRSKSSLFYSGKTKDAEQIIHSLSKYISFIRPLSENNSAEQNAAFPLN